ncbi:hypothetical protein B0I72DRAFT_143407 [Yarrowia lipolytica]|jgi:hypothetical protein|uniref:Uncharacterized protein n=1 Tax=Yarrowia lipolytica TaxID=4952 RepID=A0A371C3T8_YARLL|nr:hypothetical protein BKA91DRAFT_142608 [Yarrowia lipolytica]KAE8169001.1 hypothetical protein BKA90DRAFT_143310 [Yarrowia lipolytica]RDW24977.1 hypothetical protein B0I71DRAFT_133437 [Yarrowia lipolytica]RDW29294.1 hypothetical protein B0I72DRAFT_143407 [Yarrowia lipolytica]RDW40574.1 hypothetical protein B0I73DRAFT_130215 [Yarrowia lipolytica]
MNLFSKSEDGSNTATNASQPDNVTAGAGSAPSTATPAPEGDGTNSQEKTELGKLTAFVKEDPQNTYYIDGEREVARSSVCRNTQQGRTCLQLLISSKVMFQQMQKMVSIDIGR